MYFQSSVVIGRDGRLDHRTQTEPLDKRTGESRDGRTVCVDPLLPVGTLVFSRGSNRRGPARAPCRLSLGRERDETQSAGHPEGFGCAELRPTAAAR